MEALKHLLSASNSSPFDMEAGAKIIAEIRKEFPGSFPHADLSKLKDIGHDNERTRQAVSDIDGIADEVRPAIAALMEAFKGRIPEADDELAKKRPWTKELRHDRTVLAGVILEAAVTLAVAQEIKNFNTVIEHKEKEDDERPLPDMVYAMMLASHLQEVLRGVVGYIPSVTGQMMDAAKKNRSK